MTEHEQMDLGIYLLTTELRAVKTTWCSKLSEEVEETINKLQSLLETL